MAISGPAPKPAHARARRNKDPIAQTIIRFEPGTQPPLPDDVPWPPATIQWWADLGGSPQAELFTAVQWDYLRMVAMIHADIYGNFNIDAIPTFQRALAPFPLLPADMLKLRVTAAQADEMDARRPAKKVAKAPQNARDRIGPLRVVRTPGA